MPDSLFDGDPALEPAASGLSRYLALRRLRRGGYATLLVENPPIDSCDAEKRGQASATRAAQRFAQKDEQRMAEAEQQAGLVLVSLERLGALEAALREWLHGYHEDCASGGNGSDSVDIEALESSTRVLLDQSYLSYLVGEPGR